MVPQARCGRRGYVTCHDSLGDLTDGLVALLWGLWGPVKDSDVRRASLSGRRRTATVLSSHCASLTGALVSPAPVLVTLAGAFLFDTGFQPSVQLSTTALSATISIEVKKKDVGSIVGTLREIGWYSKEVTMSFNQLAY